MLHHHQRAWQLSAALAVTLATASASWAQSAYGYDGYSSDGVSRIDTWVVISGDMTGGTYNHSYYAENGLGATGGTMSAGPTTSAVTLRNDQSAIVSSGQEVPWLHSTSAYCDFVGPSSPFYSTAQQYDFLSIHTTTGSFTGSETIVVNEYRRCGYQPACAAGTATCGYFDHYQGWATACSQYRIASFFRFRPFSGVAYCVGVQMSVATSGPGPCD